MLSRSATTTAVTSTSLGHASVTACTRAGSASWMRLITAKHRGTNADNIQGDERRPETHGVASVALVGMRVSFLDASAAHRNDSEAWCTQICTDFRHAMPGFASVKSRVFGVFSGRNPSTNVRCRRRAALRGAGAGAGAAVPGNSPGGIPRI